MWMFRMKNAAILWGTNGCMAPFYSLWSQIWRQYTLLLLSCFSQITFILKIKSHTIIVSSNEQFILMDLSNWYFLVSDWWLIHLNKLRKTRSYIRFINFYKFKLPPINTYDNFNKNFLLNFLFKIVLKKLKLDAF